MPLEDGYRSGTRRISFLRDPGVDGKATHTVFPTRLADRTGEQIAEDHWFRATTVSCWHGNDRGEWAALASSRARRRSLVDRLVDTDDEGGF
ncbi:hypothetical protein B1756_13780 [Natrarchaeobaculum aegyptiacum]|uniref:Uncharacterized protein n=1 Tax=Natrarchaeobaculum aegyptiacum TaxID=745377 RepID=A0A2Z2HV91_9EURY|nr:hypothetical protein B1756_13780 [Natrarchaeobaculum aegyptiacum]